MSRRSRVVGRALCGAVMLSTASCGAVPGGAAAGLGGARGSGALRREDRVVLTRTSDVTAVAASQRMVYVATTGGLAIYDRTFQTWRPPLAAGDALPNGRPTALAADPSSDGVWVGGVGSVTYYQATTDFETSATVPGIVEVIAFDRGDPQAGAYVRASGQWSLVSSSGFVRPLSPAQLPNGRLSAPPSLRQLYQEYPALQSFSSLLTRDAELRSWPVSAAAKSPDRTSELWVGTMGGGLFRVDPNFNQAEQLPFGLLDRGAGALALAADGVWVAGLGDVGSSRGGLTFVSDDLQRWRWLESGYAGGGSSLVGARSLDLEVRGNRAWLATDRGVARIDTRSGGGSGRATDVVVWSALNGLPSDVALSVAARPDGAWVGTSSGLVFVSDSGSARSAAPSSVSAVLGSGGAVRALLATGDTLWVGTDFGLDFVPPAGADGTRRLVRAGAQETDPRLARRITALATSDSAVAVATDGAIIFYDRHTGRPMTSTDVAAIGAIGGVRALAMDGNTVWAAGPSGVVVVTRATGAARFLSVPRDVPAEAFDVVLERDYAWIATRDGVVRLRRLSDGSVP
ncbi:MAG TPA: hypothetical protein VFJ74_09165 [Gemmatimonadaceae bacterium]|nr:hypothetical protein [Gemmatimonadaceae bacterium]